MLLKTNILTCGLVIGFLASAFGEPQSGSNQPSQVRRMGGEERERMGIQAPTWDVTREKIDPRIHRSIQEEEQVNRGSRSPLAGDFKFDRPGGFVGEVHVLVTLRPGVVKEIQSRVLAKLTAREFQLEYQLRGKPALIGWVGKDGLYKLNSDPDVVSIALDDTRVIREKRFSSLPLPTTTQPGSKVEAEIARELEKNEFVDVSVYLEVRRPDDPLERAAVENEEAEKRVLSKLGADHFRLNSRLLAVPILYGSVDSQGLRQLMDCPDVKGVNLTRRFAPRPTTVNRN
jgi:hypothetical protein